jgi:hypothetical protein
LLPHTSHVLQPLDLSIFTFKRTPIPLLRALFAMRRKGQGFANSHLGRILNGELLTDEHFVVLGVVKEVKEGAVEEEMKVGEGGKLEWVLGRGTYWG